ncbi:unnamed protein product [Sphagnum balticum]
MCYSNFNDIIHSIIDMDADVITIENSRSNEKLLSVFREGASQLSVTDELLRGYVKGGIQFMITNTLDIFASSAIKALIALNMIRTEKVGDLDTIDVLVNAEEMLQLLKASISSTNVLNDVFGKYCADVQCAPITKKNTVFFPQCADPPCHQCSRMGPPIYPAHSESSE